VRCESTQFAVAATNRSAPSPSKMRSDKVRYDETRRVIRTLLLKEFGPPRQIDDHLLMERALCMNRLSTLGPFCLRPNSASSPQRVLKWVYWLKGVDALWLGSKDRTWLIPFVDARLGSA